jgi:molybdopterin converting factor small subunit
MSVTVEFYGIPRRRTGVTETTAVGATLGDVLLDVGSRFPEFASDCLVGSALATGYSANLNGETFVSESATAIADGDVLLILSSDAGG